MRLTAKELIKDGSIGTVCSYAIIADMRVNGQIVLSMTFKSCTDEETQDFILDSKRDGYNSFYGKFDIGAWDFVDIVIEKMYHTRIISQFYLNSCGEIAA
jgi:hypothetical protein